jgi:hypothetical protein
MDISDIRAAFTANASNSDNQYWRFPSLSLSGCYVYRGNEYYCYLSHIQSTPERLNDDIETDKTRLIHELLGRYDILYLPDNVNDESDISPLDIATAIVNIYIDNYNMINVSEEELNEHPRIPIIY